ncbi:hypothetical protein HanRHA438_Chr09g0385701 [Helianthus annuus]|nr:hypothetical protein HanRHA438_Chr09g0385701 [Helianthus annuus]
MSNGVYDGNVYTWSWGGAMGTFFEAGHSSGGKLVRFQIHWHPSLVCLFFPLW